MTPTPRPTLSPWFGPSIRQWTDLVVAHATETGLDPDLVAAVIVVESGGDPQAVSVAGAMGLMQVMPFWWAADEDPFDPEQNIAKGTSILRNYIILSHGSIRDGIRAYYSGLAGAEEGKGHDYLERVWNVYQAAQEARVGE